MKPLRKQKQSTEVYTAIETITPYDAQLLLDKNSNNRNINDHAVKCLAKAMKNGEWEMNGETIKVAVDGTLLDGQHRLAAIVSSKIPVQIMVVRNLPVETVKTIDIGRARTNGETLKMAGITGQHSIIAAAVKIAMDFRDGTYVDWKERVTPTETLKFVNKNKGLLHSEQRIAQNTFRLVPRSISVAMHFLFSKQDPVKADVFFAQLFSGADLKEGNPILTIRTRLVSAQLSAKRPTRREYISYLVKAWHATLNGNTIKQVRYNATDEITLKDVKGE